MSLVYLGSLALEMSSCDMVMQRQSASRGNSKRAAMESDGGWGGCYRIGQRVQRNAVHARRGRPNAATIPREVEGGSARNCCRFGTGRGGKKKPSALPFHVTPAESSRKADLRAVRFPHRFSRYCSKASHAGGEMPLRQ